MEAIKSLIGEDRISEGFKMIEPLVKENNEVWNEVLTLKARYSFVEKSVIQNTINFYEENLERSKIRVALLQIIDALDLEMEQEVEEIELQPEAVTGAPRQPDIGAAPASILEYEEEDIGYIDFLIDYHQHSAEMNGSLTNMSGHLALMSDQMRKRTEQLTRLNQDGSQAKLVTSKKIAAKFAEELMSFVEKMNEEISVFRVASNGSIENAFRAVQLIYEAGLKDVTVLEELFPTLVSLHNSMLEMRESVVTSKRSFLEWVKFTKEINRAKRFVVEMHDKLYLELVNYIENLEGFKDNVQYTIKEIKANG